MKEKEQHIEQLLLERDLERSEVAKSSIKLEDVRIATSRLLSFRQWEVLWGSCMDPEFMLYWLRWWITLQAENQLAALSSKYTRLVNESEENRKRMKSRIEALEAENSNLSLQLDEEKR